MIRTMCHWPGCTRAARGYYCDEHKRLAAERKKETRLFEGTRRKKSAEWNALYHTKAWRKLRNAFLAEHPVCAICHNRRATTVDHITPHRGDEELFFSEANLQALCSRCHSRKTLEENNFFRKEAKR